MKYLLLLLPFTSFAQMEMFDKVKIDSLTGEIVYDTVFNVTGTAEQLFTKEKLFISSVLKSPASPEQVVDKEMGMVSSNAQIEFSCYYWEYKKKAIVKGASRYPYEGQLKLKMFAKDNKVKFVITGLYYRENFRYPKTDYAFYPLNKKALKYYAQAAISKDRDSQLYAYNINEVIAAMDSYAKALTVTFAEYLTKKSETDF